MRLNRLVMGHDHDAERLSHLKRLRVVCVVMTSDVTRGGCVAVSKGHVTERWTSVSLEVPKRELGLQVVGRAENALE
jgi:hypothetical protein